MKSVSVLFAQSFLEYFWKRSEVLELVRSLGQIISGQTNFAESGRGRCRRMGEYGERSGELGRGNIILVVVELAGIMG